jgi:hypothetical protein
MPTETMTADAGTTAVPGFDQVLEKVNSDFAAMNERATAFVRSASERAAQDVAGMSQRIDAVEAFKRAFGKSYTLGDKDGQAKPPPATGPAFDPSQAAVGAKIGQGSFGQINWVTTQQEGVGPLVAKTSLSGAEEGKAEIERELANYERAGAHPNLLKCHGMQTIGGQEALVLEGIKGRTMTGTLEILQNSGLRVSEGKQTRNLSHADYVGATQYMALELLSGLAHLEECGLVHNDIRPDNIMIDELTGNVKIVDLGNAAAQGSPVTADARFPLQSGTVAPDLVKQDASFTPGADVFALGSSVYGAMEKDKFKYRQDKEHLNKADVAGFAPPQQALPKPSADAFVDTEYTRFINTMMNPDPAKRPSAKALMSAVRQLQRMTPADAEKAMAEMDSLVPGTGIRFLVQRLTDDARARDVLKQAMTATLVQQTLRVVGTDEGTTSASDDESGSDEEPGTEKKD